MIYFLSVEGEGIVAQGKTLNEVFTIATELGYSHTDLFDEGGILYFRNSVICGTEVDVRAELTVREVPTKKGKK